MKNCKELIDELATIEMDEACHSDQPEEYNSKLDFYLSNVQQPSYLNYIKDCHAPKANEEELLEIQETVITEINRRYEAIQLAASMAGRKGGKSKSAAKAKASAENGKKGGRPRKQPGN